MLREATIDIADLIRPPRRMRVSDAGAESLYISESMRWDPDTAPYMIRPMDETASRHHDVVCFVGPARTGKTLAMVLGRYVYTVLCHPLDFAVIHSSQDLARDLSIRDLARLHRYSPGMREACTSRASDDNTYDKRYRSGILGVLGWPSSKQLASRTIPVMLLTDYGRWPGDIGGEGDGFTQARKRTQTAGSLAMTVVESSPGEDVSVDDDSDPPVYELGKPLSHAYPLTVTSPENSRICPIYNGGTREWWYVPCQSCGEYYPQDWRIERFSWCDSADPLIAAETAGTVCCWCGAVHPENTKRVENANGRWIAEGQMIDCHGKVTGESRLGRTYPSFSIGGGAAAYQTRKSIAVKYLTALHDAHATGDENALRGVIRNDFGSPYTPIKMTAGARAATPLQKRAESLPQLLVPEGVRFLVASVDVQSNRFVAQVHGYGPDRNRWIIDRYNLAFSRRATAAGDRLRVNPASYDEDWDELTPLLRKTYELGDASGRRMAIAGLMCDSGGADGVTDKAYAWWRRLPADLQQRCRLVKGEPKPTAPLIEQRWPDTRNRKDRHSGGRGDVPVIFINTRRLKDRLDGDLARDEPGTGYCHFPDWLEPWFFRELTREKKDATGAWSGRGRNEAWDLMVYAEAMALMYGIEKIDWDRPPEWAAPWDSNALVMTIEGRFLHASQPGNRRLKPRGH